jgi:hypothetical protein
MSQPVVLPELRWVEDGIDPVGDFTFLNLRMRYEDVNSNSDEVDINGSENDQQFLSVICYVTYV